MTGENTPQTPLEFSLDHVIVFVNDLAATEAACRERLGLDFVSHSEHPGFGTRNAVTAFEDSFIEILGLANEGVLSSSRYGRVYLDRRSAHGEGPTVFVFKSPDLDEVVHRCHGRGGLCEDTMDGYTQRANGDIIPWHCVFMPGTEPVYLDPRLPNLGGTRTFPGYPVGQHAIGARRIQGVVVAVNSLDESLELYRVQLGLLPEQHATNDGVRTATLRLHPSGQELILAEPSVPDGVLHQHIQSRGQGIFGIILRVDDPQAAVSELRARGSRTEPLAWLGGLPSTDPAIAANIRLILT